MRTQRLNFAEFYRVSADECLRSVLVSVGDRDRAQDLVDEAFARAWASWRTVSKHPAPKAWVVRTVQPTLQVAVGLVHTSPQYTRDLTSAHSPTREAAGLLGFPGLARSGR